MSSQLAESPSDPENSKKEEGKDDELNLPTVNQNASSFRTDRYGSFRSDYSYNIYGDGETVVLHRPRRADNYYGFRQEYWRSYTFTRESPTSNTNGGGKPGKLKERVKRLKAVGWAILCCKYKPAQAKSLREKLSSRSSRFFQDKISSSDSLSSSSRRFTVSSCIRPTVEVVA
ncbi:hypothetical protein R1flu_026172 [Riccia fluitans]|uniref:Uncharacterized protein n=1 Tax=Riccia fluitans TaxID=41844 RepID=A0ABD1XF68_9MARC